MNRLSYLLLPLLVLAIAVPIAPLVGGAYAAPGAAYTTVDPAVDGTGHCWNGNPGVNCNIYNGKPYVWLNGGPRGARLPNGDYFFAVFVPGGHPNPNDNASPKNLSDDFDAYTNRTSRIVAMSFCEPRSW